MIINFKDLQKKHNENPNFKVLEGFNKNKEHRTKEEKEKLVFTILTTANWEMVNYWENNYWEDADEINNIKEKTIKELYKEYNLDLIEDSIENVLYN